MGWGGGLVGRAAERQALEQAVARLEAGSGGFCLVGGEAGAGKTALVESVLRATPTRVLRGPSRARRPLPYGPLRVALGEARRTERSAASPDDLRADLERLAEERPTTVFFDDLQWADAASLDLLAELAAAPPMVPLLLVGAYRSDELSRSHGVRRIRSALRRDTSGASQLIELPPLDADDSAAIVRGALGDDLDPVLLATVLRRAQGLPFYLQELAASVRRARGDGARADSDLVPESIRDAVLERLSDLSAGAQSAAELAAAAGSPLQLDLLVELVAMEEAVDELLDCGILVEAPPDGAPGLAAFRHDLVAEALHAATPWSRRRRHHTVLATALAERNAAPAVVASHWLAANNPQRARPYLLAAADEACSVHAYRDAKDALERALATWVPEEEPAKRLVELDRLAACAERCGDLTEARAAWEEVAVAQRAAGHHEALATVERRLAGVYELERDWHRAVEARRLAATCFERIGRPADAAGERLAVALHAQSAGDLTGALDLVRRAAAEIDASDEGAGSHVDLRATAMGLEGLILAKLGDGAAGVALTTKALDLAVASGSEALGAEIYYLHADALEHATDYEGALGAWGDAVAFCRSRGLDADAHVCLACITPALRHTGQWDRTLELAGEILALDDAPEVARMVAAGEAGLVLANRGETSLARRHLTAAAAFAAGYQLLGLEIEVGWGLARIDELDGDHESASDRLRGLVGGCIDREERHYCVAALRWATTYFGRRGLLGDLGSCTDSLARMAATTGTREATAALAHALGERALAEGDARRAADQFERALELLAPVTVPAEIAESQVRAGVALASAGDRRTAIERLLGGYHAARRLGARPLAASAARELEALGERVAGRSGRGGPRSVDDAGLTSREREVLRILATGLTNRQIAEELYLSTRTVDMHVRNLLTKLGCRTRTEAARRAGDLGLLDAQTL